MNRPSPKARPWSWGPTSLTIADPDASGKHFDDWPWGCVTLSLHRALLDHDSVPRVTSLGYCDRAFTLAAWARRPTARWP